MDGSIWLCVLGDSSGKVCVPGQRPGEAVMGFSSPGKQAVQTMAAELRLIHQLQHLSESLPVLTECVLIEVIFVHTQRALVSSHLSFLLPWVSSKSVSSLLLS